MLSKGIKGFKTAEVIEFLGRLKKVEMPDMPMVIFWDNASIHKAKLV